MGVLVFHVTLRVLMLLHDIHTARTRAKHLKNMINTGEGSPPPATACHPRSDSMLWCSAGQPRVRDCLQRL